MIPKAEDHQRENRLLCLLRRLWFVGAATALPLTEFLRSGSSASLTGTLVGASALTLLLIAQLYILLAGRNSLSYRYQYGDLLVQTATKTLPIPIRQIVRLEVIDLPPSRFISGVSVTGYHVGSFQLAGFGRVRLAASARHGQGLMIVYRAGPFFRPHKTRLIITPDEPEVVKLTLETLMQEERARMLLGQP